jgi:hypothetical protein
MKVILGADPNPLRDRTCDWHPDADHMVFPLLLETTDGHLFRLMNPITSIRPEHELLYLPEMFNTKSPSRVIDDIVNSIGDKLDPELKAELLARLEPFQRFVNAQGNQLTANAMKIDELEQKLRVGGGSKA